MAKRLGFIIFAGKWIVLNELETRRGRHPWFWIPTLYFAEGMPNVVVTTVAIVMFKLLGISNAEIAFYTSWLYLPWVVKPLWSPLVDIFKRKRWWILTMQLAIGGSLAGVALVLPGPDYFRYSLVFLWLLAFSSATHDIAADGFYMIGLTSKQQAYFVGIRNTFYRIASVAGQGGVVVLAGRLAGWDRIGNMQLAWSITFGILAVLFALFFLYHRAVLPRPAGDVAAHADEGPWAAFRETFVSFFRKPGIGTALTFILVYRLAESQLLKIASPFLLDAREAGGLALSPETYGVVYGTIGVIALMAGGITGGIAVSRRGLKAWIWWMACAMNLPNVVYLYMALAQPESLVTISACVVVEQFGYGFGFTAFMLYLILFAEGASKTAHYALCTGFMALGLMLPGMFSGWIQEAVGYANFFVWVLICTIPGFLIIRFLKIPENFGKS